jgi:phage repressor protein C with HTH and peptisase S24 domain
MGLSMGGETERYNLIREKTGLSKKGFADSLGLSFSMNYQISSGRIKLPRDLLDRLAKVHNVNLHWFLTGEGNSGIEPDTASIELFEQEAAAGLGREAEGYSEKQHFKVPFSLIHPHRPENLKAVYVSGDSMVGEHINDGDIVIFNTKFTEVNGIYVLSVGSTLVVKRVDFDTSNQAIVLISANPAYEPRRFSGYELENIRIAGRVIACYHKV